MDIFKKTLSELIAKSKPLQYIVVVGFFVFGLVWTFTNSDEVEQLEKQKMDRIINSINQ